KLPERFVESVEFFRQLVGRFILDSRSRHHDCGAVSRFNIIAIRLQRFNNALLAIDHLFESAHSFIENNNLLVRAWFARRRLFFFGRIGLFISVLFEGINTAVKTARENKQQRQAQQRFYFHRSSPLGFFIYARIIITSVALTSAKARTPFLSPNSSQAARV